MKFNKLFFAAVAFAALALVGCKKDPVIIDNGGEEEQPAPEMPSIAAPAAGQTTIAIYAEVCPKGAYLVGSNQGYNINDDALSFVAVPGAENWYAVTIDYAADLQVKAIARPSDEDVAFGWSYQWGPNFDASAPQPLVEDETKNNTIIIGGTGEFVFENQGEVKLANVADAGVVFVWVKAWKTSPIIEAKKLETCWLKSNLNGADWAWYEMTAKGNGVFELEAVWGGSGCNISETEAGAEQWYALDHPKVTLDPNAAAGDKVKFTFTSEKGINGTLKIDLVEKGQPVDPGEPKIITVKFKLPADWTNTPTAWVWPTGGDGAAAALTQEGAWWVYTTPEAVAELNIIVRNGDDWGLGQTVDIKTAENACYQIGENDGNREVTAVDCE